MPNTLLLISDRPEDQAFAQAVANANGFTMQSTQGATHGVEVILQQHPSVVFVDVSTEELYQAFETAIQDTVGLFSDRINSNVIHFISSAELEDVPYLIRSPLFGHFLTRREGRAEEAGRLYGRLVHHAAQKQAFGIQGLLAPGTKIQVVKVQASNQKSDAVEAVRNFAIAARFQTRMATVIANAVDEILMNSIFDAPVDELGRPLYKATARTTVLKLEGRHSVEMHVGFDGEYIAIGAVDRFGSLDKNSLLTHVSRTYTDEEYKVKNTAASAGIGLATVYRSGGSLFFASENRVKTEVVALFKRTQNYRDFKSQFRFLSTQFYF